MASKSETMGWMDGGGRGAVPEPNPSRNPNPNPHDPGTPLPPHTAARKPRSARPFVS